MGDPRIPHAAAPPPPPPSPARSSMPMLYYGIVVIGTAAIVLALYNLIIVRWCADISDPRARWRASGRAGPGSSWRFHHLSIASSVSSFKYRGGDGDEEQSDCAVCLSAFEEGEEVRQLPKCKHCFHAPCIDMWLYSHMDCPLCRCAVELPEQSREGWMIPVVTSGCCKPPMICGYQYSSPTTWIAPLNMEADADCSVWENDPRQMCYGCDSCKTGLLGNLRREWRKIKIILIVAVDMQTRV